MLVRQKDTKQPKNRSPVWGDSNHIRSAAQFAILPLQDVGRMDLSPVGFGKVHVAQNVLHGLVQQGCEAGMLPLGVQG